MNCYGYSWYFHLPLHGFFQVAFFRDEPGGYLVSIFLQGGDRPGDLDPLIKAKRNWNDGEPSQEAAGALLLEAIRKLEGLA